MDTDTVPPWKKVTDIFLCLSSKELKSTTPALRRLLCHLNLQQTVTGVQGKGLQRIIIFCPDNSFLLKLMQHFLYSSTDTSCLLRSSQNGPRSPHLSLATLCSLSFLLPAYAWWRRLISERAAPKKGDTGSPYCNLPCLWRVFIKEGAPGKSLAEGYPPENVWLSVVKWNWILKVPV